MFNNDRIYSLDISPNAKVEIGNIGSDAAWGLAYDPASDTIYGLVRDPSDGLLKLAEIDRTTGQPTFLGPGTNALTGTSGLAFDTDRGVLVAFDNADVQFWEFDTSGNPRLLWDTGGLDGWGMDYVDGQFLLHARLFTNGDQALNNRLFRRIDPYARTVDSDLFTASEAVPMEALDYFAADKAHLVYVGAGETAAALDFGTVAPFGTLSGSKFEDRDGDGTRDPDEGPLEGVTIYVDLNDNGVLDAGAGVEPDDFAPGQPLSRLGALPDDEEKDDLKGESGDDILLGGAGDKLKE